MAAAYSMDLRERVITDSDAGLSSKELAERYHVSRAWVDALNSIAWRRWSRHGPMRRWPRSARRCGPPPA